MRAAALDAHGGGGTVLSRRYGARVRVGIEATGSYGWFRRLLSELGHELVVGDATRIRASNPRRQKTDKRDAEHILGLLVADRFPAIWQPPAENEQTGQHAGALAAGGGGEHGAEVRSELASAVSAPVDGEASRRGQGGYRPQAGGEVVLDVALRARLSAQIRERGSHARQSECPGGRSCETD